MHVLQVHGEEGEEAKGQDMKPTPGPPYSVKDSYYGATVEASGVTVGRFEYRKRKGQYVISHEQARANAEAWIAGVAALEKLRRMRQVLRDEPLLTNERMQAIDKILDEP